MGRFSVQTDTGKVIYKLKSILTVVTIMVIILQPSADEVNRGYQICPVILCPRPQCVDKGGRGGVLESGCYPGV